MKIQRYDVDTDGEAYKHHKGDYVKYSDLQELVDAAPVVYYSGHSYGLHKSFATHKARLMFIEELKQECAHEPVETELGDIEMNSNGTATCHNCHIQLYPNWKPKGGK